MSKLLIFLISFFIGSFVFPAYAKGAEDFLDVGEDIETEDLDLEKLQKKLESDLKERKNQKNKKGKDKVIVPPNDEDIILELDTN